MCEINVYLTDIVYRLSDIRNFKNMKVTKKGDYALRALVDLALNYDKGIRRIQDIAREEAIPQKFLEQILILLRNADFIRSRRGANGGYFLSRPPHEISLGEVIRRIDGSLAPLDCASKSLQTNCPREITCGIRSVMLDVRNATAEIMDRVTLEDVCNRTKGTAERRSEHLMYHI
jgi:Rrf2 family protein